MARSGTSVLGHLLASAGGVREIWEPFNWHIRRGVPDYYPYVGPSTDAGKREVYRRLIDDTLRFRLRGAIRVSPDEPLHHRVAKTVVRTSRRDVAYLNLRARQLARPWPHILVKDPIAVFLSEMLVAERGFSVVVVVRHPAALLHAHRARGWPAGSLGSLLVQADARNDLFGRDEPAAVERDGDLERMGVFFRVAYGYLLDVSRRHPGTVTFVRHEDFCDDASTTIRDLLGWTGLPPNAEVESEAARVTSGAVREHQGANLSHVQQRDARWARDGWRETVTADELRRVVQAAEPVVSSFYDD
jgi:hypothetical protein